MQYWIIVNEEPTGPFDLATLRQMNLGPDTPVWHTGLPDWTVASRLPELHDSLSAPVGADAYVPPVPANHNDADGTQASAGHEDPGTRPPSYMIWAIVATILCCVPVGIAAIIYSSKVNPAWHEGRFDDARRYSEITEWLLMITIVAGLVWAPFSFLPLML